MKAKSNSAKNMSENRKADTMKANENKIQPTPVTLPLIPVRGIVVFPYMTVNFDVGREKSISAANAASNGSGLIFLPAQKDTQVADPAISQIHNIGTVAKIKQIIKLSSDNMRIVAQGLYRAKIDLFNETEPHFSVTVTPLILEKDRKSVV